MACKEEVHDVKQSKLRKSFEESDVKEYCETNERSPQKINPTKTPAKFQSYFTTTARTTKVNT